MSRRVLSLALAGSIALTSIGLTAAPARADHDDTAKVILGAAALFLLLNHANKADNDPQYTYGRKALPRKCRSVIRTHHGTARIYSRGCLKSKLSKASFRSLPGQCKTSIRTNHGWRTVYKERCMRRLGWRTT